MKETAKDESEAKVLGYCHGADLFLQSLTLFQKKVQTEPSSWFFFFY